LICQSKPINVGIKGNTGVYLLVSLFWKIHDSAMASPTPSSSSNVTSGVIDLTEPVVVPIPPGTVIDLTVEAESCDETSFECGGKRKADTDIAPSPKVTKEKSSCSSWEEKEEDEDEDEDDDDSVDERELKYGGDEELIVEVFNVVGKVYTLVCFVKYEELCEDDVAFLVENYDMCDIPLRNLPGYEENMMILPCDWCPSACEEIRTPVIRLMQYGGK
jgi:hypothetical protein